MSTDLLSVKDIVLPKGGYTLKCLQYPNQGEEILITKAISLWDVSFHCLLKRFDKEYSIPAKQSIIRELKPRVDYLESLFEMAAAVHARQQSLNVKLPFKNAAEWFTWVFWDIRYMCMHEAMSSTHFAKGAANPIHQSRSKDSLVSAARANLRKAKNYENSLSPSYQTLYMLLEGAMELAQRDSGFYRRYYKPFLTAWDGEIRMLEKWKVVRVEEDAAFLVINGRQKRRLRKNEKLA